MESRADQTKMTRAARMLVDRGFINEANLEKALIIQRSENNGRRRRLAEVLVDDLELDRHTVYSEMARVFAFQEVELMMEALTEQKIEFIKGLYESLDKEVRDELLKNNILPYEVNTRRPDSLLVLTDDPTNRELLNLARKFPFRHIEMAYCRREALSKWKDTIYPPLNEYLQIIQESTAKVETIDTEAEVEALDESKLEQEINKSLLINLVEGALIEAVRRKASDIHVIPGEENHTTLSFRIDGRLQQWLEIDFAKPEALAAVLKDRSRNIDRFERETAQDGFIQRKVDGHIIRYRVSILPIVHTEYQRKLESVVVRILDDRNVITDLSKLGLQKQAKAEFEKAIRKPQGMVILTGPTGSGKSTTLMAALHHVITPELNILTVEDPVEYVIRGARQIKIGPHLDFEGAMRCILRHDPDIVMVGEIRDRTTAEIAIKLANTGHLTFTTLHTNDAASAISRLFKMGVEPFLIGYAINLIVAQRLIRTLCERCKAVDNEFDPLVARALGFTDPEIAETTFYKPVGCEECNHGYKGRTAITEALYFTKEIRRVILEAGTEVDEEAILQEGIKNGMLTLRASGRERIKEGVTTCQEIMFATTED
jgi:type IV pilus assembly protein PilB